MFPEGHNSDGDGDSGRDDDDDDDNGGDEDWSVEGYRGKELRLARVGSKMVLKAYETRNAREGI